MATPVLVNNYSGVQATALVVRGQACNVQGYHIYNSSDATAFVQFYDSAVAPTVGTTVAKWVVAVPTLQQAFNNIQVAGLYFQNGLWIAATTTASGSTNPSAALVVALAMS
jgi:hypothetical protein